MNGVWQTCSIYLHVAGQFKIKKHIGIEPTYQKFTRELDFSYYKGLQISPRWIAKDNLNGGLTLFVLYLSIYGADMAST